MLRRWVSLRMLANDSRDSSVGLADTPTGVCLRTRRAHAWLYLEVGRCDWILLLYLFASINIDAYFSHFSPIYYSCRGMIDRRDLLVHTMLGYFLYLFCHSNSILASGWSSGKTVVVADYIHWELLFSSSHALLWFTFQRQLLDRSIDRGKEDRTVDSISHRRSCVIADYQIEK